MGDREAVVVRLAPHAPRFWRHVEVGAPTECWEWTGSRLKFGHGAWDGPLGKTTAHRYAWMLTQGEIPNGTVVRHACDNPPCCNPAHLEIGTQRDNVEDMIRRGRASFTETACRAGHPRTPDNVLTKADGTRRCKACDRGAQSARRAAYATYPCPFADCEHAANIYNLARHVARRHGEKVSAAALRDRIDRIEGAT